MKEMAPGDMLKAFQVCLVAIPIATSCNTFNMAGEPRKISIPLYVIHSEDDELFPFEEIKPWVEAILSAGTNVPLEIVPDLTHYRPYDYVALVKNPAKWFQDEV